jgi:trimeric autotransporter adhesin
MATLQQYSDYSQLSMAAYSTEMITNSSFKSALQDNSAGFTASQAELLIASGWEVISQSSDLLYGDSGFSATLFHNTQTGEYVFANRGTAGAQDLFTDGWGIALLGTAGSQTIDMYRYYKQLITPAGQAVSYSADEIERLRAIGAVYAPLKFATTAQVEYYLTGDFGLGKMSSTQTFATTGHSLGGHLALWLNALAPSAVSHVYTYNGAGLGGEFPSLLSLINGVITGTPAMSVPDSDVTNLYAYGGPAIIAGVGGSVGPNIPINIEFKDPISSALNGLYNHSIVQLTDAIAVANLLNKLDANITTSKFNDFFDKSSNKIGESLEGVLDSLRKFFGMTDTTPNDNRTTFYNNLYALQNSTTFQALIGKVTLVAPPTSASEARADLGAFLSLYYLTPFALKVEDAGALNSLYEANDALADLWNDDRNLTSEQIANSAANFSDMYLNDRAAMLSWQNLLNEKDFSVDNTGLGYVTTSGQGLHFEDKTSGRVIDINKVLNNKQTIIFGENIGPINADLLSGTSKEDHLYGMSGNDTINGGNGNDYIEGNAGQDTLNGGEGNDILMGGTDVDILDGGLGNDFLKGGAGVDVYQFNGTYGTDIITDSDGQGFVTITTGNDTAGYTTNPANGGTEVVGRIYRNEANKYNYTLLGSGADQTLIISKDNDQNRIIVRNWQTGNLAVNLQDQALEAKTQNMLTGDFEKFAPADPEGDPDARIAPFEWVEESDELWRNQTAGGNYIDHGAQADTKDLLQGTGSTNSIYGYGNDDALSGQGGDDYLNGGDGNDLIFGGTGKDTLVGGAGNDVLIARYNATFNDLYRYLSEFGNSKSFDEGFYANTSLSSNSDEIGRGWGWASSRETPTAENDVRNSIFVNSVHYMGFSDENSLPVWYSDPALHYTGYVNRQKIMTDRALDDFTSLIHIDPLSTAGGSNIISGDAGNDYILGGDAADFIDGGADDDEIYGKEGDDIIKGGAGKDVISGDGFMSNISGDTNFFWNVSSFNAHGNDIIDGGAGDDWIFGQGGNDVINGGDDNDNLWGDEDRIQTLPFEKHGDDYLDGGAGNDQLVGGGGNDILYGGTGNDILLGDGTDAQPIPEDRQGKDYIDGGAGDDTIFGGAKEDTLLGGLDNDQLVGGKDSDYLDGGEGDDKLWGGDGDDEILGSKGNDFLNGEDGNDTLVGGIGKDKLYGGANNDVLVGSGDGDLLNGEAGADTIYVGKDDIYIKDTADTVIYLDKQNDPNQPTKASSATASLNAALGSAGITISLSNNISLDIENGLVANENVAYSFGDGSEILHSDLVGAKLNSVVNFSSGAAALFGGVLDDTIIATGATASTIYGGFGIDTLTGNSANNVLQGGAGTDSMTGGVGDDTYFVDDSTDLVFENTLEGLDTVNSSITYTLGANLENLILTGTASIGATGNAQDNIIAGNTGTNTLSGGTGNDILNGMAGNDTLNGGAGDDQLQGGDGNDTYQLNLGDGEDVISDTDGINTISFGNNITVQDIQVTQYQGDDGSYYLRVQYSAIDSIVIKDGLTGSIQQYRFSDGSSVSHADLIGTSGVPFEVHGTVNSDSSLYGSANGDIIDADAGDDQAFGLAGDDILNGEVGSDTLNGGDGNDILDGGLGNDTLIGGTGQDSFSMYWGMGKDIAIDGVGAEINTLQLDPGITLSDLDSERVGDDLFINFKTTDKGIVLKDYYAVSQQWQFKDAAGQITTIPNFLAISDSSTAIQKEFSNYQASIKAKYYQTLGADGYRLISDGNFRKTTVSAGELGIETRLYSAQYSMVTQVSDASNIFRSTQAYTNDTVVLATSSTVISKYVSTPSSNTYSSGAGGGRFYSASERGAIQVALGSSFLEVPGGVWVFGPGTTAPVSNQQLVQTRVYYNSKFQTTLTNTLENVVAGDSDNTIIVGAYSTIDAGAGNDTIYGSGSLLYGNAGNDFIFGGSSILIGGDGSDIIEGSYGADRFVIFADETGTDVVSDSGQMGSIDIGEGVDLSAYALWYYTSLGMTQYDMLIAYFDNALPPLPYIAANDYAKLAPLYATGIIEKDTVEFGEGILLADSLVSRDNNDLFITWGVDKGVQIKLPEVLGNVNTDSRDWGLGAGIEQFKFTDGTIVSMEEMLARATVINHAPQVVASLNPISFTTDLASSQSLSLGSVFSDSDVNDSLTYSILSGDSSPLPAWLVFNPSDFTVTANPNNQDIGDYTFIVRATDSKYAYAETTLSLNVTQGVGIHLTGTENDDSLYGGNNNDILEGLGGVDTLSGGSGYDTLIGGAGNDTMAGGFDGDYYEVDSVGDVVVENFDEGFDEISSTVTYTLAANIEALSLGGTDAINGTGNELDNQLNGNEANNILDGQSGNDEIYGGLGSDTLIGGAGDDELLGELSDDTLVGGVGNDTYYFYLGDGHDQIDNTATDNVTATDTLYLDGIEASGVLLSRVTNDLLVTVSATDSITVKDYYAGTDNKIDQIKFSVYNAVTDTYSDTTWDRATFEAMALPSNHAPVVTGSITPLAVTDGSALNYVLPVATLFTDADQGDALAYTVTLADGNPLPSWLNYDSATSTLSGIPDPTHIGNLSLRVVAADLAGATAGIDFDLAVAAMPDQTIIGTTANNNLVGGSGNDILDGLAGVDTMSGGYGNDTYFVERAADQVIEQANQGIDTINTTVTYTASTNVENLTLLGTASTTANGNTLDNTLTGNTGNNTLDGKTGVDSMLGGLGNDTYVVDDVGDVVTELENEGTDTVRSNIDYTLGDYVERLTLTGTVAVSATGNALNNILTGSDIDNQLVGGDGNDNLNGGLGADTLIGGLGNDTYFVENALDVVVEQAGEGTDVIQASVTYTLAAEVENLTLTGTAAINGTGNELNNTLTGNIVDNQLNGGAGNDNLNGGVGADTMLGGVGNDIYTVDNANDVVIELAGEGTDRVNSSIDYTLGAETENLTLTGTTAISGTGNELNNTLTGNTADNVLIGNAGNDNLNGGVGADTMLGGQDNDIYTVDNANDAVTELAGEGTDRVNSSINYILGDNLENLTLTGTADIMGFGNNLANVLAGNIGNNYLYGLAANDTITGNTGYDILQGGDNNDTISGNAGNGLLDGGTGNDRLTGGVDNDLKIGGTGNDTIITGAGFDVIAFNKGDGVDIVSASTGADNTLSLGGNFAYSDLSLTKTGNNLILKMGETDQITFTNWYASSPTNKSVVNLQVIAEAMQGFSLGGADALRDNNIENFNFAGLVAAFDAEGATANWQLTDARLAAHLQAGSDSAAIGGDLAYQYGKNSNLTGMGLINAQSVIAAASFGQSAQTLNNPSVWQAELVKLG